MSLDLGEIGLMAAKLESKDLQLKLSKNEIDYNSYSVQLFIPVVVTEDSLQWLKIIAENTLISEDEQVVKNFLAKAESIRAMNSKRLHSLAHEKIKDNFKGYDD